MPKRNYRVAVYSRVFLHLQKQERRIRVTYLEVSGDEKKFDIYFEAKRQHER